MQSVVSSFERFFDGLGLMTGDGAITKRLVVGALAGAFLITYFKPSIAFEAGKTRPWVLFATGREEAEPTLVPWWVAPVAGAFVGGVMI